jgi:hypothetical protein
MCLGRTTIVPQRTKDRIGVDAIAGASKEAASVIVAQVVAKRGLGAGAKRSEVRSGSSGLKDGITDRQGAAIPDRGNKTRVAAHSAVSHIHDYVAVGIDSTTAKLGRIAADGGVNYGQWRAATIVSCAADATSVAIRGRVPTESAVGHGQRCEPTIVANAGNAAAEAVGARCGVAAESAIEEGQCRAPGDAVVEDGSATTGSARQGGVATEDTPIHCEGRVVVIDAAARRGGSVIDCDPSYGHGVAGIDMEDPERSRSDASLNRKNICSRSANGYVLRNRQLGTR